MQTQLLPKSPKSAQLQFNSVLCFDIVSFLFSEVCSFILCAFAFDRVFRFGCNTEVACYILNLRFPNTEHGNYSSMASSGLIFFGFGCSMHFVLAADVRDKQKHNKVNLLNSFARTLMKFGEQVVLTRSQIAVADSLLYHAGISQLCYASSIEVTRV